MQKVFKTAIVGGGAGGLLSAVELTSGKGAIKGEDVIVFERNDRVGKKLIATGNGQGNLSNSVISEKNYYGDKGFIKTFLSSLNGLTVKDYFFNIGIPVTTDSNGKQYPISKQASAVLDILLSRLIQSNVQIETKTKIISIVKEKEAFKITTDARKVFYASKVIMAVGGKSQRQFGTDGASYSLLEKFGHKLTKLYPSLVQLKTDLAPIKGLKGVKEKVRISAFDGVKLLKSVHGDLLFTQFGISGDSVFNLSAVLVDKKNPYVIIEFMPELNSDEIIYLLKMRADSKFFKSENILDGLVNKRLAKQILIEAKSNAIEDIVYTLQNFKLKVTGSLGFDYSQVTKGGIITDDVNPITMQSKLCKGLYIVGEALNVDGDCGGYNLNFAFLSAIQSAKDIKNSL